MERIPNVKNSRFDVVILGAGPAGLTIARDADSRGLKVLLIDQGFGAHRLFASTLNPKTAAAGGFGGATSGGWGGQLAPLYQYQISEFAAAIGANSSWRESLISAYHEIARMLQVQDDLELFWDSEPKEPQTHTIHTFYPKNIDLQHIFAETIESKNLMYCQLRVNRLVPLKLGFILETFDGQQIQLVAKKLFICLGTVETTRLLTTLTPSSKSLEFQVRDHPMSYLSQIKIPNKRINDLPKHQTDSKKLKYVVLIQDDKHKRQAYGVVELQPLTSERVNFGANSIQSPFLSRVFHMLLKLSGMKKLESHLRGYRRFVAWGQLEQLGCEDCRLTFKDGQVKSTWSLCKSDIEGFDKLSKWCEALVSKYEGKVTRQKNWLEPLGVDPAQYEAYHPSGTIAMHNSAQKGIVNEFGELHKSKTIMICSSAIFPFDSWQNPTLTIMALSLMISRNALSEL